MSDERLLKCPFCGGEATFYNTIGLRNGEHIRMYGVMCKKTFCATIPLNFYTAEQAAETWNNRQPVADVLERLSKELSYAIDEKKRCKYESRLMFNSAKGYENAISNAIEITKEELM